MKFIGDVHGKMAAYLEIIQECDASIQVGDFGAGFVPLPQVAAQHRFIRGNHDDPSVCKQHANWIPDGHAQGAMFHVGGAFSIDRELRTLGVDWWDDEELGYEAMSGVIAAYEVAQPQIMVTHDCPQEFGVHLFGRDSGKSGRNRTNMGLQTMWEIHRPRVWIFGHWHQSVRKTILGCEFMCLAELEHMDLDIG
jgi:hypothetical protein